MKKWIMAGAIAVMGVSIFFGYKHLNAQELRPDADYHNYSLSEIESLATVIVEADWEEETNSIVKLDQKDKYPLETRTFSNIKVKKVYKGEVKEGQELNVVEYYAKWRDVAGAYVKYPNELYQPLKSDKNYLLFLYQSPEEPSGSYEIIGNHQGKYVYPETQSNMSIQSTSDLDIAEKDEHYSALYNEVSEKYFK
ncbi:hypothetical protein EC604_16475 [Paenibacillus amylolyticus]|jgi:hypothetical protein|uniref:Uncharacterized protein n=1 Tax=Paenibacillus amylolyticus TaxID=1451 RepID=A0A5M9WVE5_PAEAM|nr:hypothetical protein [Paenibacillus amylolyticus]KAA8785439.1 hypothetical protein EC604_16475 [Paenibacillus amylolyticus]